MSPWSNRFISLGVPALLTVWLAACASGPSEETPASIHVPVPPAAEESTAAAPSANAPAGANPPAAPAGGSPRILLGYDSVPVPPQAAQQYAEALRQMRAGRTVEAESEFKQLAGAYPALAGPEVNLGLLYLQGSHLLEAETAFRAALERNPANAVAGSELGITERKLGKFTEAEAAYQRTIAAQPDYAPAYLNLGVLYDLYLAEPQKALEQFEHYIQLAGENKQVAGWMVELRKRVGAPAPAAKKEPA